MAYAENTKVDVNKTKAEIETMIHMAGATQFVSGFKDNTAVVGFVLNNRQIRFLLPLPDPNDDEFVYTPARRTKRSKQQAYEVWNQACKSKWRSLYLIIKAKLEAVDSGISTIEREFFYDIVLPNGQTVGEFMAPQIEQSYQSGNMPPLLPMMDQH